MDAETAKAPGTLFHSKYFCDRINMNSSSEQEIKLTHEPKRYDLPNHLARIFDSPGFHTAAKEVGKTANAQLEGDDA